MAFQIRWTQAAADDFEALVVKVESDSDFLQSCQVAESIHQRIEGLQDYPYIGEALGDFPGLRRRLADSFKIIYQVFEADKVVEITRILGQRQEVSRQLRP